jgi:hypothetical protein
MGIPAANMILATILSTLWSDIYNLYTYYIMDGNPLPPNLYTYYIMDGNPLPPF